jgi:integrase
MAKLYHPTYTDKKTGERKKLKKWYVCLNGREIPLSTNRRAAEVMLAKLLEKAELGKAGLIDPFERYRNTPLADHLASWETTLLTGQGGAKHAAEMTRCAHRLLGGCMFFAEITPAAVRGALAALREAKELPALPVGQVLFTRKELAELLGITGGGVSDLVKRHSLHGTGNGKARRFPRATAEALLALRGEGASVTTLNRHLQAAKMFAKWMVGEKRARDNPLTDMKRVGNPEHDRRREFATLTADEITRLIAAARESTAEFMGLTGRDRAALYLCAVSTAYRPVELSRLTPADFLLAGAAPLVRLDGTRTKNGQPAEQHVSAAVAAELRGFVAGRQEGEPVWPGGWFAKGADMIRVDLPAAGIPPAKSAVGGGELVVTLYALRHSAPVLLEAA